MKDFSYVIYILDDELDRIQQDLRNNSFTDDREELRRMQNRKIQLNKAINILLGQ